MMHVRPSTNLFPYATLFRTLAAERSLPLIRSVKLKPGGAIVRGTVRNSSTNEPIAGATVSFSQDPMASYRGGVTSESVTTAPDGTYAIDSSYFHERGLTAGF